MRITCARRFLALIALATSIAAWAKSPDQADPWLVLNRITHKRGYTIETRDHRCVRVTITKVANDRLTAGVYSSRPFRSGTVIFPRADVLRVTVGHLAYYSGRSSWSDVSSLRARRRERLKIVMKDGKVFEVKQPYTVSDEGIAMQLSGKSMNVSKMEIAQIYDIAVKPLSDFREYSLGELGPLVIFDPDWYVRSLHLEQYVPVLLYDAGAPEDNSLTQCVAR
jgi:hypothetical protein